MITLLRERRMLPAALVVVAIFAVFGTVVHFDFVSWDDNVFVFHNPELQQPITIQKSARIWRSGYMGLYTPLTNSVWALAAHLSPQTSSSLHTDSFHPALFHGLNLVVHAGTVLFLFLFLHHCFGSPWAACAGALLFGLHPLQVASVAWVSQLKGLLAGFFGIASLFFWNRAWHKPEQRCLFRLVFSLLLFALSLLSKASLVLLPVILMIHGRLFQKQPWSRLIAAALPFWLVAGVMAFVTLRVQTISGPNQDIAWWLRPFLAGDALFWYAKKLILPLNLAIDYGRTPHSLFLRPAGLFGRAVVCGAALYGLIRTRHPVVILGTGLFVVTLLPVSGLLPFQFQYYSTVADRYAYGALSGPALLLTFLLARRQSLVVHMAAVTLLCVLGILSSVVLRDWKDDETLFVRAIQVNPLSFMAHNNLGRYYLNHARDPHKATVLFRRALSLHPGDAVSRANLGAAQACLHNDARAVLHLTQALKMGHHKPGEIHRDLARIYFRNGRPQKTIVHALKALRRFNRSAELYYMTGVSFLMTGNKSRAREYISHCLLLSPGHKGALEAQSALAKE